MTNLRDHVQAFSRRVLCRPPWDHKLQAVRSDRLNATGDPLLLIAVPLGIIICGAASGVADALRIGLRRKVLDLMGVPDPEQREIGEGANGLAPFRQ